MRPDRPEQPAGGGRQPALDDLIEAEQTVRDRIGHLPLDFEAMALVSNLHRAAASAALIGEGFPRFNAEERAIADHVAPGDREATTAALRALITALSPYGGNGGA